MTDKKKVMKWIKETDLTMGEKAKILDVCQKTAYNLRDGGHEGTRWGNYAAMIFQHEHKGK